MNDSPFFAKLFQHAQEISKLLLSQREYILLFDCLQNGIGLRSKEELKRTMCRIWLKSPAQFQVFESIFDEEYKNMVNNVIPNPLSIDTSDTSYQTKTTKQREPHLSSPSTNELDQTEKNTNNVWASEEPYTTYLKMSSSDLKIGERSGLTSSKIRGAKSQKYIFSNEHLPIYTRELIQLWRSISYRTKGNQSFNIDIAKTIELYGKKGVLHDVIYKKHTDNKTEITLFVDREGSMRPFHLQCEEVIKAITDKKTYPKAKIYFFRNVPDKYVYKSSNLSQKIELEDILTKIEGLKSFIIIISDAGASRGYIRKDRIESTKKWLNKLSLIPNKSIIWLNPMPRNRWAFTSSSEISQYIPMFGMSRLELETALEELKKQ